MLGIASPELFAHQRIRPFPESSQVVGHLLWTHVRGQQMKQYGGMISFLPVGNAATAKHIVEGTHVFALAESLGGVESLIELPAPMTHASVAGSPLEVDPTLIRLSVGIENVDDLIEDLQQALMGV